MEENAESAAESEQSPLHGTHAEENTNGSVEFGQTRRTESRKLPAITACELCKTRKVRCDRVEPSCGWCSRNGRLCVYRDRQKPGFRAGYVRELETKVSRLESILQTLGHGGEIYLNVHDSGRELAGPTASKLLRADDDHQAPQSSKKMIRTEMQDASFGKYDRVRSDRTSELMSVQSMMNTIRPVTAPKAMPDLPSGELLYSLVDLYFKHVNTWCPILDRKITVDSFFGPSVPDEADRIILYAIVAIALRFSHDPSLTPESRKQYHSTAKDNVLLYSLQYPSIKSLQALVILTWDFLGSSDGPPSVNILAIIVRTVLQLNLQVESGLSLSTTDRSNAPHGRLRDSILPKPNSWIEEEGRRRLFWMVYIIERYTVVATATDPTLNEDYIDRSLPCRYDLFSKNEAVETRWFSGPGQSMIIDQPENLGSFSYHCEVMRTLSRVQIFLQNPIDICSLVEVERWQLTYRELDDELNSWLSRLPDDYGRVSQLCHSDPTSKISNWIILHAAFVTSVLRLHSCAAYPPVRSHIFTPSFNASQRCLAAVQSLREIAQDVLNTGMLDLLGPHFAFSLYVAARLLLVDSACTGVEMDPNCRFFIYILDKMGHYWGIASQYAQTLDRICKQSHMGWPYSNGAASSAPRALATMRRRAYEIHISATHRPSTATKPLPTKSVTADDLEYLEVFHFFNYPRLPTAMISSPGLYHPFLNLDGDMIGKNYFMAETGFSTRAMNTRWSYGPT
ncbi:fungal-specific transcription factor domain-containing protein [Talaromyces proteolyticus]|uniref:Fungal-specific transcription factor domain-containing protein n=1 Tax=Talaromyces proteolyticus TaxID=1131652 RepID=A0AAD4PW89_9EURO|nr:fungal-specific transcription factor domain-containing protein [Talaromyces proteolyticus]KAH8694297.1 fungal-specific transcription factor domain-containing protein [Talaromyces proteolyticus]